MTRRRFRLWLTTITSFYLLAIAVGIALRSARPTYDLFKDLLPLIAAVPAALLAGAYQRRGSFLQQLRVSYSSLVCAVQDAIQFTHLEHPSVAEFAGVMKQLSLVTDEFRALFMNLNVSHDGRGYYPFESLKEIQPIVSRYYFGQDFSPLAQRVTRSEILQRWQRTRDAVLEEFDRSPPTYFDSPFPGKTGP